MDTASDKKNPLVIEVNWVTFLRGFTILLLILLAAGLIEFIGLILLSILLAVTLEKVISKLESKGMKPKVAFLLVLIFTIILIVLLFTVVTPALFSQLKTVGEKIPQLKKDLIGALPRGVISKEMEKVWTNPENLIGSWGEVLLKIGGMLSTFLQAFAIVVTFAFYFVLDGKRTFDWLTSFFKQGNQKKIRQTGQEMKQIIAAYVTGQMITSALAAVFTAILLSALKVPAWLLLALFAGIMDIVPVVGFMLTIAAVGLMALTVSSEAAMISIAAMFLYQAFENYVIAPRVYGNTLRLSHLAVLMAIAIGGILAGPLGIVLALPIAAAYPPIERIWLKRYLGEEVVEKHIEIENRPADIEITH
ncbi:MAG: hypothetical protein K0R29_821 [Pseudobdellovibrio sp.]|jgi:predicted PurR-regulated permease PerM|nr:hypothetical protein [Pseudobdellovibrio sp.]